MVRLNILQKYESGGSEIQGKAQRYFSYKMEANFHFSVDLKIVLIGNLHQKITKRPEQFKMVCLLQMVTGSLDPGVLDPASWTQNFGPPEIQSPEFWTRGELDPGVLAPGDLDPSMKKKNPEQQGLSQDIFLPQVKVNDYIVISLILCHLFPYSSHGLDRIAILFQLSE